jgi:putative hydrolase of the HAD superfamily
VPRIEAVTLDANRTLFAARDLGGEYARVLARHGLELSAEALDEAIVTAWREFGCAADPRRDRFASHPGGSRGFWRRFVERVCALAGASRPSPFAAAELYERFAEPGPYRVYADVEPALAPHAGRGGRLAVVSNWDERLPRVVAGLGLAGRFETVLTSAEAGVEKPHPAIFAAALERLGVAPAHALHVGDSAREDVEGALAAGLGALRIARDGGGDLTSLEELAARLDAIA